MAFNAVAIVIQDFDAVANKGFFHGYSFITLLMILNHALSGIAVSMVMKYADNIVKVVYLQKNAHSFPCHFLTQGLTLSIGM
jgi:hypothetical protein